MSRIRIAIVGLGKIAREQHLPSIRANSAFELVGVASPHHRLEGVPGFATIEELFESVPGIDAIAQCTSPQARFAISRTAIDQGCHVLLEKPPGVTLTEVSALVEHARRKSVALYASWHSRHAAAVEAARAWLSTRAVRQVNVTWKEDVRVWHPGQRWIWQGGGLGVFDPGINALSILTRLFPDPLVLDEAELDFPVNCETPIAARLALANASGTRVSMDLDFLQTGPQTWDIEAETRSGRLRLSMGGTILEIDGRRIATPGPTEYAHLYQHFAQLVADRAIDVDLAPLQLVADALLAGRRRTVAAFAEEPA
ncbi:MAG: Gfo/Idh/MocA family protein [Steroidobacteraceae bacterium]